MVSPQDSWKMVFSWETRPRRTAIAHFDSGSLSQRRRTVVEVLKFQMGKGEGLRASSNCAAKAAESRDAGRAMSSCKSAREIWNGRRGTGFLAIEQQLKSMVACSLHSGREEGRVCCACLLSRGQQLWREGEGSGLGAGEVPAGTTTAARDWMPVHAKTRWLTDQASSATIKTTPMDRLLVITMKSLLPGVVDCCDSHHTGLEFQCARDVAACRRQLS